MPAQTAVLDPSEHEPNQAELDHVAVFLERGLANLAARQEERGSWSGDYAGPMFLLPMYVALAYVAGEPIDDLRRRGMVRYLEASVREDGSVGLHFEARRGSMFTTSLCYVALRLLGEGADDPIVTRMRAWIERSGTPLGAAAWGKFTLALLGLYDWRGLHPILPELWLLPYGAPMHPGRLWCHCRQVYLPMSWLYARRSTAPLTDLLEDLRAELYPQGFHSIDWPAHKDTLAPVEAYRARTVALRVANAAMDAFEWLGASSHLLSRLRERALTEVERHVDYEDQVTQFIDIGPVNKVLNAFVHHFRDPHGDARSRALDACRLYLWDGDDGTKMQSYNSSELWDTAFALQAILEVKSDRAPRVTSSPALHERAATALHERAAAGADVERMIDRAYGYLRDNQILEDPPEHAKYYRHPTRGGFPFSNRAHGWPITDCTAEGLKCLLEPRGMARASAEVPGELVAAAIVLILSWQNDDGGFATYERTRGGAWLELLNPSDVFGDIMVDYSYVECTSACLTALVRTRRAYPHFLEREIERAVRRAERFLRHEQRPDGSFEGSWAVCFTYGTWFGVSGLVAAGATFRDPSVNRACEFLLSKQREDGGWGEHGDSCSERRYVQAERALSVQTAWALSTLVRAKHPSVFAQDRAARYLLRAQHADGSFPREPLVGVFNRTCLINYDNYRHYFPLWAIAEWNRARR